MFEYKGPFGYFKDLDKKADSLRIGIQNFNEVPFCTGLRYKPLVSIVLPLLLRPLK